MSKFSGLLDDCIILMISNWLDLRDLGLLDSALTNLAERKLWTKCLLLSSCKYLDNHDHTHSSIRWLILRNLHPRVIHTADHSVNDLTFHGIDNAYLHTLNLSRSNITDSGLTMIAQGCPKLEVIDLSICEGISNEGVLALAAK